MYSCREDWGVPDALPISVVIPAFNAAAYLAEALDSVASQRQPPAETIVVDDGSTDATGRIARDYGVRVVTHENRGLAEARNSGIAAASMPWIALLDADDRWHPERLCAQWTAHELRPEVEMVACDYSLFGGEATSHDRVLAHTPAYARIARTRLSGDAVCIERAALAATLINGNFVLPSSLLVTRDLLVGGGVLFTRREALPCGPDFHVGEDYEWLLRALRRSDLIVVERALVAYRRSPASLSADGARLRLGDVMLGEYVCRAPALYADGVAEGFERTRAFHLRDTGWRYLATGDVVRAHAMFVRAAGDRDRLARPLAAVTKPFASARGHALFGTIWKIWRERVRPLARRLRGLH